ncbi:MAG: hypothetical protein EB055_02350 [Micrococcales bacterium]|nr:hypothetical protein [Micrococcales bacterium]
MFSKAFSWEGPSKYPPEVFIIARFATNKLAPEAVRKMDCWPPEGDESKVAIKQVMIVVVAKAGTSLLNLRQ